MLEKDPCCTTLPSTAAVNQFSSKLDRKSINSCRREEEREDCSLLLSHSTAYDGPYVRHVSWVRRTTTSLDRGYPCYRVSPEPRSMTRAELSDLEGSERERGRWQQQRQCIKYSSRSHFRQQDTAISGRTFGHEEDGTEQFDRSMLRNPLSHCKYELA